MARVRRVGPDLPSGVRRPDRAVSLRDVREQPVQTMGLGQGGAPGKFGGGYGVHTRISELDGEYRVRLFIDGEYQAGADYFTDDVAEAHETAKAMEEDAHLSDKDSDVARDEARDFVEDAIMRPDLDEVEVPEDLVADDARLPVEEMRGLTADEAFRQHLAMSGRADPNQGYFPEFEGPNERIDRDRREAKENVRPKTPEEQEAWERELRERFAPRPEPQAAPPPPPPPPPSNRIASLVSQMSGPDFDAIEEGDYGSTPWWDSVPGLDDIPEFDDPYGEEGEFNPWDPDARSMDSQMLADLNMRRAQQDQQGYFGGLGDAVSSLTDTVSNMSNTERAGLVAALVAAGIITIGSGGTMAPAGAALLGGAGLGALSSAP